jgi:hypothetical protein
MVSHIDGDVIFAHPVIDEKRMTWTEVIEAWQHREDFQAMFSKFLRTSPFKDFFFEMKPVSRYSQGDFCEFVLVNAKSNFKRMSASPKSFAEHLEKARRNSKHFATFLSLSKDSMLIAPRDLSNNRKPPQCYLNIARFSRHCATHQVDELWRVLGKQLSILLASSPLHTPVWVSTSGLAVPWLHMRFDRIPKYYTHTPYKTYEKLRVSSEEA